MKTRLFSWLATTWWGGVCVVAAVACGSSDGAGMGTVDLPSREGTTSSSPATHAEATGLPCDVEAILAKDCQSCHGAKPSYGAPMPLVTYADLTATRNGKKVAELVTARVHDTARPMPPTPAQPLGASDLAVLDEWVRAGTPASTASCGAQGGGGDVTKPLGCTPDTLVRPASKWSMPTGTSDEYVCYGFDVTPGQKRHVTALAPKVDNKSIVHHILLFQSPTAVSGTPAPCDQGGSTTWRLVAGWAPGGGNVELPPEAGFPEAGTTHWVAQVHYNNAQGLAGQTDGSGYDLCTTDKLRANDADVMAFGSMKFSIPPRASLDMTCDFAVPAQTPQLHVFSGMPHMHKLGKSISADRVRGGATTSITSQPNFDFQTQLSYPAQVTIQGGDTVRTRCAWQNPSGASVGFGEKTADEMCFVFVNYYPKIDVPVFNWSLPAAGSSCHATP